MLSQEQVDSLKKQVIRQIESTFPEDKKEMAKSQIESMNANEFEEFLKQNNLIKSQQESSEGQQCIFCSIVFGDIQSYKIGENEKAIAILEINPVSKGHTLIVPKEHMGSPEKLSAEVHGLSKEVSNKIKRCLNPKEIKMHPSNLFGHEIINILPVYENETLNSQRNKASEEELQKLQKELSKKEPLEKKPEEEINEKNTWLPKRIP